MSLTPLLIAPLAVQVHALSAILAFLLGALVLFRRKGTTGHRVMGRLWALLMLGAATSSWFINDIRMIGPFSPIHIFSIMTYVGLAEGIWHIRHGNLARHRQAMVGLYFGALVLAGAFTLLPGRRMYRVLFGSAENPWASALLIACLVGLGLFVWRWLGRRPLPPERLAA
jgi:uncharacterized membrane protein